MIESVDVVIPSMGNMNVLPKCLESLHNIPWPFTLYFVYGVSPACKAINIGLSQTKKDVILLDDDAYILPDTFKDFDKYYPYADMFGFRLSNPNGTLHHGGVRFFKDGVGHRVGDEIKVPTYVPCVTAALCFIKRNLILTQMFPEDYPGVQYEDVDFCLRATNNGFKIMYIPNNGIHIGSGTSRNIDNFKVKEFANFQELKSRFDFTKYMWEKQFDG